MNLVGNAVKYTKHGSILLSATIEKEDNTSVNVRFLVQDTGIGITPDVRETLFAPSRQTQAPPPHKPGASGLGLSIVKRLVEALGGRLDVESTPGIGSTFWCIIPLERAGSQANEPTQEGISNVRRLLVVEDKEKLALMFRQYFFAWGIQPDIVAAPEAALAMLRERAAEGRPYDAMVIDHRLPNVDGIALGRTVAADTTCSTTKQILVANETINAAQTTDFPGIFTRCVPTPLRQSHLYEALLFASSEEPESPMVPTAWKTSDEPGRRILLAEDHPVNQRLAFKQLEYIGYSASLASNGQEAVDAVLRERFDLVLMDCYMPVMDGFAATRAVREAEKTSGNHVPIVAMTANSQPEDREACLAAGMDDYIAKPVVLGELKSVIERWMKDAAKR
jgi:CheY-like chemotaxis protein